MGFCMGCSVGKERSELFLIFFEGDVLFSFKVDPEGLDSWVMADNVKLKQFVAGLTGFMGSEILVFLYLDILILDLSHGSV